MSFYFDYILKTFHSIYKYESKVSICHGSNEGDIKIINSSESFFDSGELTPPEIVWKNWKETRIPFICSNDDSLEVVSFKNNQATINYDIIGSAFYFLSGWQEFHSTERDAYGRYPYKNSFQFKHNLMTVPVVNYYFDILIYALEKVGQKSLGRKLWPDSKLAVSLSHDIDKINSGWLEGGFSELKKGRILSAFKLASSKFIGKDPWDNINEIVALESQLDVKSTFFFITKQGNGNADYPFSQVKKYIPDIVSAKSEVALHGSLGSSNSSEKIQEEIDIMKHKVIGNRFHFLMFDLTNQGAILDQTELEYDASYGFAEHVGFRNGFCFPFFPFDHNKKKAFNFLEIPLFIMDATLSNANYMGTDSGKEQKIQSVISEVQKFNGLLSILWHNNYFSDFKYEGWKDIYIAMIEEAKKNDAEFFTCSELTSLFRSI